MDHVHAPAGKHVAHGAMDFFFSVIEIVKAAAHPKMPGALISFAARAGSEDP